VNYSIDNIFEFLEQYVGKDEINAESDLFNDASITGDDFHEMIEKYEKQFSIDMSNYLWYFHTDEEGNSFTDLFFDPPYKRVNRIPVTPKMLADFANKGIWHIEYPEHKLPKRRYDLIVNSIIFGIIIIALAVWLISEWAN